MLNITLPCQKFWECIWKLAKSVTYSPSITVPTLNLMYVVISFTNISLRSKEVNIDMEWWVTTAYAASMLPPVNFQLCASRNLWRTLQSDKNESAAPRHDADDDDVARCDWSASPVQSTPFGRIGWFRCCCRGCRRMVLRVDGNDLATTASHQQHSLHAFRQHVQEFDV